jgi:hypothetical protein
VLSTRRISYRFNGGYLECRIKSARKTSNSYDVGVGKIFSVATTGFCNVFTYSGKPKSVDDDALVLRTMTGAPDTSLAGLIGSTTDSWIDEVSESL